VGFKPVLYLREALPGWFKPVLYLREALSGWVRSGLCPEEPPRSSGYYLPTMVPPFHPRYMPPSHLPVGVSLPCTRGWCTRDGVPSTGRCVQMCSSGRGFVPQRFFLRVVLKGVILEVLAQNGSLPRAIP